MLYIQRGIEQLGRLIRKNKTNQPDLTDVCVTVYFSLDFCQLLHFPNG